MKILIINFLYLLLLWPTESEKMSRDGKSIFLYKQGVQNLTNYIPYQTSNFKDLMKNSKCFMDHSLFVTDALNSGFTMILAPSNWGKSLNLDMLRTFIERQLDKDGNPIPSELTENYKIFTSGDVTLDDGRVERIIIQLLVSYKVLMVQKHLGRQKVVFVNFTDTLSPDYETAIQKIGLAIHGCFKQHSYMVQLLEKRITNPNDSTNAVLEQFKKYLYIDQQSEIFDEIGIIESFRFLCQTLFDYYKKRIYILIDDYDRPIHGYFMYDNFTGVVADKLISFMNKFGVGTMEDKSYKESYIITATFHLEATHWTYAWYQVAENRMLMHGYFGFNNENVKAMLVKFGVQQELWPLVEKWYGGYKSTFLKKSVYHPTSILKYLTYREFQSFRINEPNTNFIRKVIRTTPYWRHNLLTLLSKQPINCVTRSVYKRKLGNLTNVWQEDGVLSVYGEHITFLFLLAEAYVIEIPVTYPKSKYTNYVKIPNYENAYAIADWLRSYYKQAYQMDQKQLDNAAASLHDFASTDSNDPSNLRESFNILYKQSIFMPIGKGNISERNHHSSRSILHTVALHMQCKSKFQLDVYYYRTKTIDVVIVDEKNQQAVAIELTYNNSTAQYALQMALNRTHVFNSFDNVRKIKFLGINVSPDKKVEILSQLENK